MTKQDRINDLLAFTYFRQNRADELLEVIHDELVARCGSYKWTCQGSTHKKSKFAIVATDEHGQTFVESRGKTPKEALFAFSAARTILEQGIPTYYESV